MSDFIFQASRNYIAHFLPHFLLFGGDGNLRHIPAPFGVLLLSSLPFALIGLYSLLTEKRGRFSYWVLLGLLVSPLPSALTIQSPHVLRSIGLLVFICILFWYGVEFLYAHAKVKMLLIAWSLTLILESTMFLTMYFSSYPKTAAAWFDSATVEMINKGTSYDGPFFLSSKLYPGTEATVHFLQIANHPQQTEVLERAVVYDPDVMIPMTNGVFFFDTETCGKLPKDFVDVATFIQNYSGNCLYIRKI